MSSDDFGSTTLSPREVRTLLIGASTALVLLLAFGFALAVRLATTIEPGPVEAAGAAEAAEVAEPGLASPGLARDAPPEQGPTAGEERAIESLESARAVRPGILSGPRATASEAARFGVRVGIFAVPENADRMLQRLQASGYAPFVIVRTGAGESHRYVYAVSARTELAAASLAEVIRQETGLPTYVEPIEETG